jgi:hypothetical protein
MSCQCSCTPEETYAIKIKRRPLSDGTGPTGNRTHDVYSMRALALPKPERSNRSSGLISNSYLLDKQMIIHVDNS